METVQTGCCKAKRKPSKKGGGANGSMSFLSTLLLILLPKCPLCLTAYMSAVVMFLDIENSQLAPFLMHAKPVLGAVIVLMIVLNSRGKRTLISLGIAGVAMTFLLLKTYYSIAVLPDGLLYTAFFFAIWYNGNFRYFFHFIRSNGQKVGGS